MTVTLRFGRLQYALPAERLLWLLPIAIWFVAERFPAQTLLLAMTAGIATGVVVIVSNHPLGALCALAALLPWQLHLPAILYRVGVPAEILRPLASWKEIVVVGVLVAAYQRARVHGLDGLDRLVLAFLGIVVIYAALPGLVGAAAPTGLVARLAGIRQASGFLILFLACRHLDIDDRTRRRVCAGMFVAAIILGGGAVAQKVDSPWFANLNNETIGIQVYAAQVRGLDTQSRSLDFTDNGRPGSFYGSGNSLAGYLVIPFALGLARLRSSPRRWIVLATAASVAGAIISSTRGAIIAMAVAAVIIFWSRGGATPRQRTRLAVLAAAGIVVLAPLAFGSGLVGRFGDVTQEADPTEQGHRFGIERGLGLLVARPLGLGIGTTTGIGERFSGTSTVNDNQYVITANELGIIAGSIFVAITIGTMRGLWRRRSSVTALGPSAAFVGFSLVGMFAVVYEDLALSWSLWMLVGFELSRVTHATSSVEPPEPEASAWAPPRGDGHHL